MRDRPEYHDPEAYERDLEERLRVLGDAAGIDPGRLTILGEAQVTLSHLGIQVSTYKVMDAERGDARRIGLDAQGRPVDVDDLLQRERSAAWERYGNLQEALYELLTADRGDDDVLPVMLRYAVDDEPIDFDKRELETATLG